MMSFADRKKKVEEKIEKDLYEHIGDLKENANFIINVYRTAYTTFYVLGNSCFSQIYNDTTYKDYEECASLTEKCIKRSKEVVNASYLFEDDKELFEEFEDMKMLWTIVEYDLLPLEIFWGMEYLNVNDQYYKKVGLDLPVYEYLESIANYYLKQTKKYVEMVNNNNIKTENKTLELKNKEK